jgi:hypothetical protein
VLEAYEVSPAVNHVANDSAELIAAAPADAAVPAPEPRARAKHNGDQPSLFDAPLSAMRRK